MCERVRLKILRAEEDDCTEFQRGRANLKTGGGSWLNGGIVRDHRRWPEERDGEFDSLTAREHPLRALKSPTAVSGDRSSPLVFSAIREKS